MGELNWKAWLCGGSSVVDVDLEWARSARSRVLLLGRIISA